MKIQIELEGKDLVTFGEVAAAVTQDKETMKKMIPEVEKILTKMREAIADEKETV